MKHDNVARAILRRLLESLSLTLLVAGIVSVTTGERAISWCDADGLLFGFEALSAMGLVGISVAIVIYLTSEETMKSLAVSSSSASDRTAHMYLVATDQPTLEHSND